MSLIEDEQGGVDQYQRKQALVKPSQQSEEMENLNKQIKELEDRMRQIRSARTDRDRQIFEQQNKLNSAFKQESSRHKPDNGAVQRNLDASIDQTVHENQSMAGELVHEEMHRLRLENARLKE